MPLRPADSVELHSVESDKRPFELDGEKPRLAAFDFGEPRAF